MADQRKGAITEHALKDMLTKLNDVMAEAERLRGQVSRQLAEQRSDQKQIVPLTPAPPSRRKRPSRSANR